MAVIEDRAYFFPDENTVTVYDLYLQERFEYSVRAPPRILHWCVQDCHTSKGDCIYVYGDGDLYRFDTSNMNWTLLSSGPVKEWCGVLCWEDSLVMYEVYSPLELHVYCLKNGTWSSHAVTGIHPYDWCYLTMLDTHRAVTLDWPDIFYELDLKRMHWSKITAQRQHPRPKQPLLYFRKLVPCPGYGENSPHFLLRDRDGGVWILNSSSWTWRKLCSSPDDWGLLTAFSPTHGCIEIIEWIPSDTPIPTTVFVLGVQSLQRLCLSVIKSALQLHAHPQLPDYVPTRLKRMITGRLK